MPINPLDVLRGLQTQPYRPQVDSSLNDPRVQRYHLQNQLMDDTEDQIVNQTKARGYAAASSRPQEAQAYQGNIDAFQRLLGQTGQDTLETGIPQGIDEAEDYRKKEREAILGGFTGGQTPQGEGMNPIQQQAAYGQAAEMEKIHAPVRAAELQAQGGIEQARLQGQAQRDVAKTYADQQAQSSQALLDAQQSGGQSISGFTLPGRSGGGSVRFQNPNAANQRVNPTLLRDIATARANLQKAGPNKMFLGTIPYGDSPEKTYYDQTIATALSQDPANDDVKDFANFVANDPELSNLPVEAILHHPKVAQSFDLSGLSAQEVEDLNRLLYMVRGLPEGQ